MNKFIKNIFFFLLPFLVIIAASFIYFNLNNNVILKSFKLNNSINTIILGDSHTTLALNDLYIKNTKNFSNYSESYIYNYHKLLHIHKLNPNIKNLVLGVSYHNFAKYYDESTFNSDFAGKYFFMLPFESQKILLENSQNRISLLKYSIFNAFNNNVFTDSTSFEGGYHNIDLIEFANNKSIQKRINKQYRNLDTVNSLSKINIEYFTKIIDYCKENNIRLTLVRTPLFMEYKNKIPYQIVKNYEDITKNLEIINFDMEFKSDTLFMPDGDHLKKSGAKLFSKLLNQYLLN